MLQFYRSVIHEAKKKTQKNIDKDKTQYITDKKLN